MAAVCSPPTFAASLLNTMDSRVQTPHAMDFALLQACVPHEPCPEKVRELAASADWDSVLGLAERHCVVPLLYRTLRSHADTMVPKAVLNRLARVHSANAIQNLRLTAELVRILELFECHGIEAVPFKGPVLADILFGSVSLRQFADLDVLVPEADVCTAKRILVADGYRAEFDLEGKAEQDHIRFEHAFQFQRHQQGFVIELHWRFGARNQVFPVDARDAWMRLETRRFQGRVVRSLSREDLLLYLSVHGAKHQWDRLEWIVCIAELVRSSTTLDWNALHRRAAGSGALRSLYLALLLADGLGPLSLPESFRKTMDGDKAAAKLACQIRDGLCRPEPDHARRQLSRHTFYLRTRERWGDRARIVFHSSMRVPHPYARDWQLFRVPASLSFLYYLLRPIRLMSEVGFRRLRSILRPDTGF
jgi:hypothetical protein